MTAFISPYRADRKRARDLANEGEFIEIFCRCSVEACEKRDWKGLYRKQGLVRSQSLPVYLLHTRNQRILR